MGFLLMFDLTNQQSFLNVRNWMSMCCHLSGLLGGWGMVMQICEGIFLNSVSRLQGWLMHICLYHMGENDLCFFRSATGQRIL